MKTRYSLILGAICVGGIFSLALQMAFAQTLSVSFWIHNNQGNVASLEVFDASDKNNPSSVKTIANLVAGSKTSKITIATIPGAKVGRANWTWDDNATNGINITDGKTYELSSGAEQ